MPESVLTRTEWDRRLAEAAVTVIETMFFAGVYGPAEAGGPEPEPRLAARLEFEGAPRGALTVSLAEAAARVLAANFLAAEPDDPLSRTQMEGVVCELANMVCGALLSHVKTEQHFRLQSPRVLPAEPTLAPPNQALDLGDGSIKLWLDLETDAQ